MVKVISFADLKKKMAAAKAAPIEPDDEPEVTKVTPKKGPGSGPQGKGFTFDWKLILKLSYIHCTVEEIASVVGCSTTLLSAQPRFDRIHDRGKEYGKASLRRLLFRAAFRGNTKALIWLSKQHLGMKEPKYDVGLSADDGPIEFSMKIPGPKAGQRLNDPPMTEDDEFMDLTPVMGGKNGNGHRSPNKSQ